MNEKVDAALNAFLGTFPGFYSEKGKALYRDLMRKALEAAASVEDKELLQAARAVMISCLEFANVGDGLLIYGD